LYHKNTLQTYRLHKFVAYKKLLFYSSFLLWNGHQLYNYFVSPIVSMVTGRFHETSRKSSRNHIDFTCDLRLLEKAAAEPSFTFFNE